MKTLNDIEGQGIRLFKMNSKNNIIINRNRYNVVCKILDRYRENFYTHTRVNEHYIDNTMLLDKKDYASINN